MSAETLRRAAELIRERAVTATPGPWGVSCDNQGVEGYGSADGEQLADCFDDGSDALHIASWHPAVALAVADWLDTCASVAENQTLVPALRIALTDHAIAVACTYLRESA